MDGGGMHQAPSWLAASGSSASEDEHEAVIRELTRGHQLTARLRAEALRALRGQGQAEATAAFILQEVSRAFTVCLSIMSSPARAPPPAPLAVVPRRRDDSIPREQKMTSSPHYDGYQWRKYGQKRITRTQFPRCYYRCSFHRERSCRATKQVQQCSNAQPPQYLVMYFNEHTCDTAAAAAVEAPGAATAMLDMSSAGAGRRGERRGVVQEDHELQLLVSSLTCVLGGHQHHSPSDAAVAVNNVALAQEPPPRARGTCELDAPAPVVDDAPGEMPPRLNVDVLGALDVMDYGDVTGALSFGDSYGLPDGDLPF
ncbi:hypothetical protein BS78_03G318500 [Paspalum vaginatum]|nr:hypothetical protein BS78_03G318500 [Paspalum vaginatum]